MRVALVTDTFFPQLNGVSRALGELARHLAARGDAVCVVHPDYGVKARADEPAAAWPCDIVPVRAAPLPFYPEVRLALPPFGRAWRALASFRPDLVHLATESALGLSAVRFAARRGLPVVSSFHTNFDAYAGHYRMGPARGAVWRYLRWFHNQTRETYVPSEATRALLAARGFERLALWRRGADCALFRPDRAGGRAVRAALDWPPEAPVIGHVGRLAAEKNLACLAEALGTVAARRPAARVLVVGDGPARPALERRLGPFARFVGYRRGEGLADHYAACDLFAFASLTETFGNVLLEALASGLPVAALRAGGVDEIVRPGATGILAGPERGAEGLAEAIIALIDRPEQRRRMAADARADALGQSWGPILNGLRERYRRVIAAPVDRAGPRSAFPHGPARPADARDAPIGQPAGAAAPTGSGGGCLETAAAKGTVPFCSAGSAKSGQSPAVSGRSRFPSPDSVGAPAGAIPFACEREKG